MEELYKGLLIDKNVLAQDPHFTSGCPSCHKGDDKAPSKEKAHKGIVKRPSQDPKACAPCHKEIAANYTTSLHFTTSGLKHGVAGRFSKSQFAQFESKVFEKSCRSCHASCGECHVKSPAISGVSVGLIKGHRFVKKDEGKTCSFCHGGRVYPEFTGEYGGTPDVHYQKGMTCLDCHKGKGFHGDGKAYTSRKDVKERPSCTGCHAQGNEKDLQVKNTHLKHNGKVSCSACHAAGVYRNCTGCHIGKGAVSKPGFILGKNPRKPGMLTTLRLIPTVRDTFSGEGIGMDQYDAVPNYWDANPHTIRKRTERTRSCEVCHNEKKDFLSKENLIQGGAKANESLIYTPKPLKTGGMK